MALATMQTARATGAIRFLDLWSYGSGTRMGLTLPRMRPYFEVSRPSVWTAVSLIVQAAILIGVVVGVVTLHDIADASRSQVCTTGETVIGAGVHTECDQLIADRLAELQRHLATEKAADCQAPGLFASGAVDCYQSMVDSLYYINAALDQPADAGFDEVTRRLLDIESVLRDLCISLC